MTALALDAIRTSRRVRRSGHGSKRALNKCGGNTGSASKVPRAARRYRRSFGGPSTVGAREKAIFGKFLVVAFRFEEAFELEARGVK